MKENPMKERISQSTHDRGLRLRLLAAGFLRGRGRQTGKQINS